VLGSSSISYVSQSTLNIGTNLITVNAQNPSIRFGGIAVIDSGSSPQVSGSYLFDSVQDRWIMIHQQTAGSALTSSIAIMGPETYNDLGNETTITLNRLVKGSSGASGEHIGNSNISDTGTVVSINSATQITGSLGVTGASTFASSMTSTLSSGIFLNNSSGGTNATQIRISNTGGDARMGVESSTGGTIQIGTSAYSAVFGNQANAATEFTTNGTVRMTILGGGNVGIGTASPSSFSAPANLLVVGTTSGNNGITIAAGSTGFSSIYFADGTTGNEAFRGYIEYGHSADALKFGTSAGDRMIITSGGNVGIGTTSPGGSLEVVGSGSVISRFNSTATNGGVISFQRSGTAILDIGTGLGLLGVGTNNDSAIYSTATMYLGANGTQFVTLRSGNVGIGTTNPLSRLHVQGSEPNIRIVDSDDSGVMFIGNSGGYSFIRPFSRDFRFLNAAGSSLMAITSAGNVGIGTTSPSYKLDINGDAKATVYNFSGTGAVLQSTAPVGTSSQYGLFYNNGGVFYFGKDDSTGASFGVGGYSTVLWNSGAVAIVLATGNTEKMRIAGDGAVGIGNTSPTSYGSGYANLWVGSSGKIGYLSVSNGTVNLELNADGNGVVRTRSNHALILGTNETERMRITATGNAGINITNPSSKLHIVGSTDIINATSTTTDARINIGHSGNGGYVGYANIGAGDAANTFYVTNGSGVIGSGITMNNAGNVGINTTSPYTKLHVNGSIGMSVNSAGYPINAKLVKQSVNTVTFTANVGTIGAWRPGYVSLRVATAQNGLQEYQAAWYFIRVVAYFASSAIVDILDSGGNTGSYTFSYTSTGSGSPQVITFTIADSNASTDTIIADIDFSYTEGIISLS
jgi:hypothetical protein